MIGGDWLIVHCGGGLGDVLLSTCVVSALKEAGAENLDYLCLAKNAGALKGNPQIRNLHLLEQRSPRGIGAWLSWRQQLSQLRYSGTIVLWGNSSLAWLLRASGIPIRVGQDSRLLYSFLYTHQVRVRSEHGDQESHWTDILLDYVRCLGPKCESPKVQLTVSQEVKIKAQQLLDTGQALKGPLIGFHCSKGLVPDLQRWPVAVFAQWAKALHDELGATICLTGSTSERILTDELQRLAGLERCIDLAGKTDVETLAAVASCCQLFVCPDSGPMHVAAAAGCKILAIYALEEDFPKRWAPFTEHKVVIRPSPTGCPPNCLKGTCPDFRCYRSVSTAEVLQAANQLLNKP
jgi:ADP-heptose:LPS heptosyltransferase